ncbi:MAG: Smr/MutS family protein [Patescibacteria group bacterium]
MGRRGIKTIEMPSVPEPSGAEVSLLAAEINPDTETLDLHGMDKIEAEHAVELFIDRAFTAHTYAVRIVHGVGSGALRDMVRRILDKHPLVEKWRPAPQPYTAGTVHVALVKRK